jgi:hypothetical protein
MVDRETGVSVVSLLDVWANYFGSSSAALYC